MSKFSEIVLASQRRLAMPIAVQPGLALVGGTVAEAVTAPEIQARAACALQERYRSPFLMSAMDLSVEAEAFGCAINMSDNEVPTVVGNLVTSSDQGRTLVVPRPGDKRTGVYLDTVRLLRKKGQGTTVLAGCIGPFSLAARLVGMSEACGLTITDPDWMHLMLDKSTEFLTAYVQAFKAAGADGVIMAEPGAGLLSPRSMVEFSSAYIRRIAGAVVDNHFELILHNCAAKLVHLPAVLESGARAVHFGAPMDLASALAKVPREVIVCGNLDPTAVFVQANPEEVARRTSELAQVGKAYPNFIVSSGCDIPPGTPIANLDAFFSAAGK